MIESSEAVMAGDEEISFIPRFISERSMKNARRLQKKDAAR
jgi:hypothetical protein